MALFNPFPIATITENKARLPSRTYRIDWKSGRILGFVDERDAVAQAVHKALVTPRFKCLAYDSQYGSEIAALIPSANAAPGLFEQEFERVCKDCVLADSRCTAVSDFAFSFSGDSVSVSCTVKTVYGDLYVEEVL